MRLLQDHRVVAGIDVQSISTRSSALHFACWNAGSANDRARLIDLLLLHGANPFLRDAQGRTLLDYLRQHHPKHHISIALLERAMAEPQRIYALAKARHMSDAKHAIGKAKAAADKEARTRGEKMRKMLDKTPPYLKERVQGGQVEVPRVELRQIQDNANENDEEGEKQMMAVMKYVLRDQAEYGEMGGMSADVFVDGDDGAQVGCDSRGWWWRRGCALDSVWHSFVLFLLVVERRADL